MTRFSPYPPAITPASDRDLLGEGEFRAMLPKWYTKAHESHSLLLDEISSLPWWHSGCPFYGSRSWHGLRFAQLISEERSAELAIEFGLYERSGPYGSDATHICIAEWRASFRIGSAVWTHMQTTHMPTLLYFLRQLPLI